MGEDAAVEEAVGVGEGVGADALSEAAMRESRIAQSGGGPSSTGAQRPATPQSPRRRCQRTAMKMSQPRTSG